MHTRPTTVVNQPAGFRIVSGSWRDNRTHASCAASSASDCDPNTRAATPRRRSRSTSKRSTRVGPGSLSAMSSPFPASNCAVIKDDEGRAGKVTQCRARVWSIDGPVPEPFYRRRIHAGTSWFMAARSVRSSSLVRSAIGASTLASSSIRPLGLAAARTLSSSPTSSVEDCSKPARCARARGWTPQRRCRPWGHASTTSVSRVVRLPTRCWTRGSRARRRLRARDRLRRSRTAVRRPADGIGRRRAPDVRRQRWTPGAASGSAG